MDSFDWESSTVIKENDNEKILKKPNSANVMQEINEGRRIMLTSKNYILDS